MRNLNERIKALSPEQRELLKLKLKNEGIEISQLKIIKKNIYSSIKPVEEQEYYPVSSAQKRLMILNQIEDIDISYNMPGAMRIEGELDKKRLEETFNKLVKRHESLRTSFKFIEGEHVQKIHEYQEIDFEIEFIKGKENTNEKINKFIRPFDLSKAPLMRVALIKLTEEEHILLYDMNHIISDGVSMGILAKEFIELYQGNELPELRIQYKDFASWQNELFKSDIIKEQEKYWLDRFSDEIPVLNMPTDYPRPKVQSFKGDRVDFELDKELTKGLKDICKKTDTTLYMVLLAAYNVLLHKYTGQEDIIVGSPIAGRRHIDLEKMIGMFVNTLAMRNYPEGEKSFKNFLADVKENTLETYENQDYQFEELVDKLDIKKDLSRNTLFDTMFVLQNMDFRDINTSELYFSSYEIKSTISKFDISLTAVEQEDKIKFNIEYCTELYKKETIERLSRHYINIIEEISKDIEEKLKDIDILTEEERDQILYEFNETAAEYPKDKTIQELFEEQVEKTPNNIAVVYENKELTYRELNERANQLARVLRHKGVKADTIVGIMVDRSLEMIIGIMGILKAGGAYLPIDPEYPEERIKYMLEDSNTSILLTQSDLKEDVEFKGEIIDLRDKLIYQRDKSNIEKINNSRDLAYIIYTSGSTGKPKGVMVENRNVNNLLIGLKNVIYDNYDSYLNIALVANHVFDASVQQIFASLLQGHTLFPISNDIKRGNMLLTFYKNNNIDISDGTPSHLLLILNSLKDSNLDLNIKQFIIGGEKLKYELVSSFFKKISNKPPMIINVYGPTECCVDSTFYQISIDKIISIGKPMPNEKIYIVDKNNNIQPIGIAGELCIAGDGLARGYLNRPELTAEKFIDNPFGKGRMYKTGDLARWISDGNIEFLGRIDHQVKIRGYRIELGEIENQLLNHEEIKQTIVLAREESETKYLCAYYVSEKELDVSQLREHLSRKLPEYMLPSYFIRLEEIPLTPNGKIDRKALPEVKGKIETGVEYVAPRNEIEEKLVEIWEDVLTVEKVGINDNFFELGGHSLKATKLMSRIHKNFDVEIPLKEIFKLQTVKGIAKYIKEAKKSIYSSIEPIEEQEYYPVSSAQKRLMILNQLKDIDISYNIPVAMRLEGKVDKRRLEETFNKLVERHESLRTSFEFIEGEPVQIIHQEVDFEIEFIKGKENTKEKIIKFIRSFDLSKAPLIRVALIKLTEEEYILLYDMHHIISDGISMNILVEEFIELYQGNELPELRIQYKDFAVWQNELFKSDVIKEQEKYWLDKYSDEIPVLNMPTDYPRPKVQSFKGNRIDFELGEELTKAVKDISKETDTTLYMVLLATYNVLLHKYTGQEDIIVGSPIAGRRHIDLEKMIGMFVNTLAMRNYPEGDKSFKDFLAEVKKNTLEAYENQDYQFEELVDKLELSRNLSRNPLFDTMFVLQNMDFEDINAGEVDFSSYEIENTISKFDITLTAVEQEDNIKFSIEYCTELYKREKIERLCRHYINVIEEVDTCIEERLKDIDILTEEERNQILYEFNDTAAEYPKEKTIQELFEEQVAKTPDNIAVVYEDKELTYIELNEKANQLARVLRHKGVKADTIVGIMVERSLEMIIGIMGILKAGGAYLPIDPEYPEERIKYMLKDSNTSILLTQSDLKENIKFKGEIIDLEDKLVYQGDKSNIENINSSRDLAYVIYTSGSTGKPKGVMIEHKGVVNIIFAIQKRYPISKNDSFLLKTNYTFDVSVSEIFGWFLGNGKLVILKKGLEKDFSSILQVFNGNSITHCNFTPSMLSIFLDILEKYHNNSINSLKYIFSAGEALTTETVNKNIVQNNGVQLENLYGPTEATIYSTIYSTRNSKNLKSIPIGKPINNTQIYIVDRENNIQPIGIAGELCIAGDGLARGYLNRPELTAEKFINNPFGEGRMYKTGDLTRWLPDGNIEFLGRMDHQVKIRGYRIELGEIENQLLSHEEIKQTIVMAREESETKYLCAYYVSEKELDVSQLRDHLSRSLPEYMIPSYFIRLEEMPLTPNGKIDRKALPEVEGKIETGVEYVAPRNEIEEKLVEIWEDVLGVEKIGINDNFFELGGHSLKLIQLKQNIYNEFEKEINLIEFYKYPNIECCYRMVKNNKDYRYFKKNHKKIINVFNNIETNSALEKKDKFIEARKKLVKKYTKSIINQNYFMQNQIKNTKMLHRYLLSPMQEYYLQNVHIKKHIVVEIIEFTDDICKKKLNSVMKKFLKRHSILRSFVELGNVPLENYIKEFSCPEDLSVPFIDLTNYESYNKKEILEEIIKVLINEEMLAKFDLLKSLLYKLAVIKINKDLTLMLAFKNHFITDGIVSFKEIKQIYENNNLQQIKLSHKDYIEEQKQLYKNISLNLIEKYNYNLEKYCKDVIEFRQKYFNNQDDIMFFKVKDGNLSINKPNLLNAHYSLGQIFTTLIISVLFKVCNIDNIPLSLFVNGRTYGNKTYSNLMGDFHDNFFFTYNKDQNNDFKRILSTVKKQFNEFNFGLINYNNMMINFIKNNKKYINILRYQPPIIINLLFKDDKNRVANIYSDAYTFAEKCVSKYRHSSVEGISFKIIIDINSSNIDISYKYAYYLDYLLKDLKKLLKIEIDLLVDLL